jgi:tetratricopeptide (TPR) repeat protein
MLYSAVSLILSTALVPCAWAFQVAPTAAALSTPTPLPITAPKPEISPEMRGDIYMARKMYREAIDVYKPGAVNSAVLANKTGIAYHQLLDLPDAKKYYDKAIKLDRKYAEAINNLGAVYYAVKSYRRAVEQYKRALRYSPQSASILSNLGTAYFARKQYKEASLAYEQALAIDPDVFEKKTTGAGTVLQERSVEERAKYHYYIAKTYAKRGSNDLALQYIRKSLEEGFKEREKFLKDPEFASLQENVEFKQILSMEHKTL